MWVLKVKVISWPWPKVVYIQKFKPDFLRNYCADLNQTLYESFQVQWNENLMTWCWSHDQDGRHTHIWWKPLKNLILQNRQADFHETWYVALGTSVHHNLFKWWPWSDLDLFNGNVKFGNLGFSMGKSENSGFFRNYCSQWPRVGRCRQLIEFMKVCEYWWSRSFLYHIFSRFCMFCALLGQDSRWAFTGPLVLWFQLMWWWRKWLSMCRYPTS